MDTVFQESKGAVKTGAMAIASTPPVIPSLSEGSSVPCAWLATSDAHKVPR